MPSNVRTTIPIDAIPTESFRSKKRPKRESEAAGIEPASDTDRPVESSESSRVRLCVHRAALSASRQNLLVADQKEARRIALALPETTEAGDHFHVSGAKKGKRKGIVWAWNERVEPKKPRVPRADVVAIRVLDQDDKEAWLSSDETKFFTEPHYDGFPAVLVRLPAIPVDELEELIVEAWRCQASRALVESFDRGNPDT